MASMAPLATLLVRIRGDADKVEDDVNGGLSRVESSVNRMGERLRTASSAVGAGIGAGLAMGITSSLETEAAGDKLAAQLGVSGDQAVEAAGVQSRIYASAWGDSLDDVGTAVATVSQNFKGLGEADLERISTKALGVAQIFDQDVSAAAASAGQMIRTGMVADADEAFDVITTGFQMGIDKSGDFLDTLNEYGTQFRTVGIDGKTMLGLVNQGLQAGARDADTVADAIKEFAIEAAQGGEKVVGAWDAMGLSSQEMLRKLGEGGSSASEVMTLTLQRLQAVEDPIKRNALAVELFGTKAEDLGSALYALDPTTAVQGLGDVAGAADSAMATISDSPAVALEQFKRTAMQKLGEVASGFVQFGMQNKGFVQPLVIALGVLAGAILAARVGMAAWTAAQTAWRVATAVGTAAQWAFNAAMAANPLTLVTLLIVGLVAGLVALYMKSETAREIINGAFSAIWGAIQAVYNWVRDNWPLLLAILTGPFGLAVLAIVKNWDSIKGGASAVIGWLQENWPLLLAIITGPIGMAVLAVVKHWDSIKGAASSVLTWFQEMPPKVREALSPIGEAISSIFKAGFNGIARLWNGTVAKLRFQVPNWVPKLGGKGWSIPEIPMLAAGGIISGRGPAVVGDAGPELLDLPRGARVTPLPRGVSGGAGGGGQQRVVIDVTGADAEFRTLMRRMVRVHGQGSVQTAFGR